MYYILLLNYRRIRELRKTLYRFRQQHQHRRYRHRHHRHQHPQWQESISTRCAILLLMH